ncbi:hypothetical protein ATANTOWER_007678 [Ataeniobius toweri]|uniref:Uncharacterized protein n=1 Tax=Ataeniobius toweri TaxID=208326 RepID=A0ABU7BFE1_9TELE|nr:hypothetical protein [Ataeniobius toweri]
MSSCHVSEFFFSVLIVSLKKCLLIPFCPYGKHNISRLHPVVCGLKEQFCSLVSCCGSVFVGSLHCTTQPAGLVPSQTGPTVDAGGLEQDSILLHYCTRASDLDALLAASDWRPLPVVSASCTLEYLVPPALLCAALPLLGHHLQHPCDF